MDLPWRQSLRSSSETLVTTYKDTSRHNTEVLKPLEHQLNNFIFMLNAQFILVSAVVKNARMWWPAHRYRFPIKPAIYLRLYSLARFVTWNVWIILSRILIRMQDRLIARLLNQQFLHGTIGRLELGLVFGKKLPEPLLKNCITPWTIGWGGVEWIHLAQDGDRWRAVVNAVMNLRVLAPRN
jgi:hypothetical protein